MSKSDEFFERFDDSFASSIETAIEDAIDDAVRMMDGDPPEWCSNIENIAPRCREILEEIIARLIKEEKR